eukprot:1527440-Rhodomonas_salina.1
MDILSSNAGSASLSQSDGLHAPPSWRGHGPGGHDSSTRKWIPSQVTVRAVVNGPGRLQTRNKFPL